MKTVNYFDLILRDSLLINLFAELNFFHVIIGAIRFLDSTVKGKQQI